MDKQTIATPLAKNEQRVRLLKILSLGAAFAVISILFIAAFIGFRPDQFSLSERYFPSPTHTPTRTPRPTSTITPSPTLNMTATMKAKQATQSALAFQATAANAVTEWPAILTENFDTNDNTWRTGTEDNDYAKILREVKDGKYYWDASAHQDFLGWIAIPSEYLDDFYMAVEMQQVRGPSSEWYGVFFRYSSTGQYYFRMNNSQQYELYLIQNGDWRSLLSLRYSPALRPGGINQLAILAEGDHFMFFINDQFVDEVHNDVIRQGTTAMVIELRLPRDQAIFEFDNLEVRTTPQIR